ncbi:MAG: hypothetical protein IPN55_17770 [Saprospiraceae bacterium]|nr:hypothetical protein [Candidatus Brachybacter algidus]
MLNAGFDIRFGNAFTFSENGDKASYLKVIKYWKLNIHITNLHAGIKVKMN